MRHDQPTTPFDVEAEEMTQQFWGTSKSWISSEQPTVRRRTDRSAPRVDDTTGSLRVIRDGFAAFRPQISTNSTGEIARQRQHGSRQRPTRDPSPIADDDVTLGELAAGHASGRRDASHRDVSHRDVSHRDVSRGVSGATDDVPLRPVQPLGARLGLGAIDPLLFRAGCVALALILLVPVVLSLRPERDDTLPGEVVEAPQPAAGAAPSAIDAVPAAMGQQVDASPAETSSVTVPASTTPPAEPAAAVATDDGSIGERADVEATPVSDVGDSAAAEALPAVGVEAAAVDVAAERIVPSCPQTYAAAAGDSWYRIADAANVTPNDLLAENNATTETVILPGDDICLPEGATMPSPPTVTTPTSEPAEDATPTTEAPSTTAPTTTVAAAPVLSPAEVRALISETWPEDEVDTALAIAERESGFVATADNGWCCVGVFQIYWTVHRGWLDDFGISQRSDLFDARKNVAAAFHLWQQTGWGPWGG